MTSSYVDRTEVEILLTCWLRELASATTDMSHEPAAATASYLVGLLWDSGRTEAAFAFECGFELAVAAAQAVLSDPHGDPRRSLQAACDATRQMLSMPWDDAA